mgnify:CR=1 FL=1
MAEKMSIDNMNGVSNNHQIVYELNNMNGALKDIKLCII